MQNKRPPKSSGQGRVITAVRVISTQESKRKRRKSPFPGVKPDGIPDERSKRRRTFEAKKRRKR